MCAYELLCQQHQKKKKTGLQVFFFYKTLNGGSKLHHLVCPFVEPQPGVTNEDKKRVVISKTTVLSRKKKSAFLHMFLLSSRYLKRKAKKKTAEATANIRITQYTHTHLLTQPLFMPRATVSRCTSLDMSRTCRAQRRNSSRECTAGVRRS